jgi:hypothetical protein
MGIFELFLCLMVLCNPLAVYHIYVHMGHKYVENRMFQLSNDDLKVYVTHRRRLSPASRADAV